MKKLILSLLAALSFSGAAFANSEGVSWYEFPKERVTDMAALQNGAKLFVNYCLNCHSAAYMRYNRLRDIGLTEDQIKNNLVFTGVKVGELMKSSVDPKEAKAWFGGVPPDLSLVARSRSEAGKGSGADYIYTYLRSYYRDDTKATGWNNLAFPSVAMPNVLWQLQGEQRPVYTEQKDEHDASKTTHVFKGFEAVSPGTMSQAQFNENVADLVAYMTWMAEPTQHGRRQLGVWVLLFLGVLTFLAWRLNAAYWKDVK